MELGFCGLGKMGAAMVERLIEKGHGVTVWNRSPEKAKPLVALGARLAESPAALARGQSIVVTMLLDDAALAAVYDGKDGLLAPDVAGKLFIEMSTVRPGTIRDLAQRVRGKGAALVESPVSGTVGPAREGKLLGLVGGESSDVARARPVLEALCRRIDHLGPNGAGSTAKLAVNLPLILYWEALGEAMALTRDSGINPKTLVEIMAESSGGTNAIRGPRGPRVAAGIEACDAQPEIGFQIEGYAKDLRTILATAQSMNFALPLAAQALRCYEEAQRGGWADRDGSALAVWRFIEAKKARS
jgi:3-hydroxyisobutyrate dehydrogenase